MKRLMKNKIKYILFAVALCVLSLTFLACACNVPPEQLPVPSGFKLDGGALTWEEMPQAKGFTVDINGREYNTTDASYDLKQFVNNDERVFKIKIKAVGDGKKHTDSEYTKCLDISFPKIAFTLTDNGRAYEIAKCLSETVSGNINLPDTYNGKPVVKIADSAFKNCDKITGVTIPDSIIEIGGWAFRGCTSLKKAVLPNGLKVLEDIFANCKSLEDVVIPDSVEELGDNAFWNCESLADVVIPEGVVTIGKNAFLGCKSLKSINIPSSVTKISGAFKDSCGITELTLDKNNTAFKIDGNCLIRKSDNAVVEAWGYCVIPDYVDIKKSDFQRSCITELTVSDGITEIPMAMLSDCKNLKKVSIPASVTTIRYDYPPFEGCENLTEIAVDENNPAYKSEQNCILNKAGDRLVCGCAGSVIPSSVQVIGTCAFYGSGITDLIIPGTVKIIEKCAFYDCYDWTTRYFHKNLESVDISAFYFTEIMPPYLLTFSPNTSGIYGHFGSLAGDEIGYDEDGYAYLISRFCQYKNLTSKRALRRGYTFGGFSDTPDGEPIKTKEEWKSGCDKDGNIRAYAIWIPVESDK